MIFKTTIILALVYMINASSCHKNLKELAEGQRKAIYCITTNSVPVTLCTDCVREYNITLKFYDDLAANCASLYFDKDRINLVTSTQMVLTGLWSKAFCNDCYKNDNNIVFYKKISKFNTCLQLENNTNVCETCKIPYLDLNKFYSDLDIHNNGEVCYDFQDSMNRTRNTWSKVKKCSHREQNLTWFTFALCIVFSLPVLFYGSIYWITKNQECNHGVLSNSDGIRNSELPTSSHRSNITQTSNTTQPLNANFSNIGISNAPTTTNLESVCKRNTSDSESSDDDNTQINTVTNATVELINL